MRLWGPFYRPNPPVALRVCHSPTPGSLAIHGAISPQHSRNLSCVHSLDSCVSSSLCAPLDSRSSVALLMLVMSTASVYVFRLAIKRLARGLVTLRSSILYVWVIDPASHVLAPPPLEHGSALGGPLTRPHRGLPRPSRPRDMAGSSTPCCGL
jgi:hypothetical protein